MRHVPALLLALTTLAPGAASEAYALDAAGLHAQATLSDVPACPSIPAPCLVGHEDNGTLLLSDDTIYTYRSVDQVTVVVDGTPVTQQFSFDLASARVNHTLVHDGHAKVSWVEERIPPPLGNVTSTRGTDTNTWILVQGPGLDGTNLTTHYYGVPVWWLAHDEDGLRIPNGFAIYGYSTDRYAPQPGSVEDLCISYLGGDNAITCRVLPMAQVAAAWYDLTPNVVFGVAANRAAFSLGETGEAPVASTIGEGPHAGSGSSASDQGPGAGQLMTLRSAAKSLKDALPPPWLGRPPLAASPDAHPLGISETALGETGLSHALLVAAAAAAAAPLLLLYHRLTRDRALRHAHRARLLQLAGESPGLLVGHAAQRLGTSHRTAHHHARVLDRHGFVSLVRAGRYWAIYPRHGVPASLHAGLPQLRRGPQADALRTVLRHPGRGVTDLARAMGCGKSAAHAKLKALLRAGLVTYHRRHGYLATAAGLASLRALRDGAGPPSAPRLLEPGPPGGFPPARGPLVGAAPPPARDGRSDLPAA